MPQPRRSQPAAAAPAPAQQPPPSAGGVAGVAAVGGVAGALPGAVGALAIPSAATRALVAARIIASFGVFSRRATERDQGFLRRVLAGRIRRGPDLARLLREETSREREFRARAEKRMKRDLTMALGVPDPADREAKVRAILDRERQFVQMRVQAMVERAAAAADRMVLRETSPTGAFWRLGVAQNHTEGCRFMAGGNHEGSGRFWPWEVLDRVHPPRHAGCTSTLHGYGEAVGNGWLAPTDVPNVTDAIRAAHGVVMEDDGLLVEAERAELRAELERRGWLDGAEFDRVME